MDILRQTLKDLKGYDRFPSTNNIEIFLVIGLLEKLSGKLLAVRGEKTGKHWNRIMIELIREIEDLESQPAILKLLASFIDETGDTSDNENE